MTQKTPLISIGFTCFNAEKTIGYALQSALDQTWPSIEIIVVDDGSTDNSIQIVQNLQKNDPRIILIQHEHNQGTAVARTTIAQNANGEFLAYFDDDDKAMPERLKKQYERIIKYENKTGTDIVFCYSDRYVIKAGQTEIDHIGYGMGRISPEPYGEDIVDLLLWKSAMDQKTQENIGAIGSGTLMMRLSVFEKVGYFDPDFRRYAEWDLAIRAALKGAHLISVPEPLIIQYKTPTSEKKGLKPLYYSVLLRKKNKDYLSSKGVYRASVFLARSKFYFSKKYKIKGILNLGLACLYAPVQVLWPRLKNRLKLLLP